MPMEGPVPKSYPLFLIAILFGGGWYFTKGPGQVKLGDIFASFSQGQSGAQRQGQYGGTQSPQAGNYGNYSGYPAPASYGAPASGAQTSASYASQSAPVAPTPPAPMFGGPAIRIASFNIQVFGDEKAKYAGVVKALASAMQNFQ